MCTDLGKWSRCKDWEAQDRNKISNFPKPLRDLEYQEQEAHAPKYKREGQSNDTYTLHLPQWGPPGSHNVPWPALWSRPALQTQFPAEGGGGGQISWKRQRRSQFSSVSSTLLSQLFTSLPAERSTDPPEYTLQWPASAGLHPVVTGANR